MAKKNPNDPLRILGIDPGLNITGYGLIDCFPGPDPAPGITVVEAGVLRSPKTNDLGARLVVQYGELQELIEAHAPDVVALEKLYTNYERPTTAILMGHARGVLCLAVAQSNLPLFNYAATEIKKALTGSGRAPKSQIQHAVMRHLNITDPLEPPDVADALAIAMCHYFLDAKVAAAS